MKQRSNMAGFSLIELMLAIALGLVVLASVTGVMVSNLVANTTSLKIIRLDQDLRAVMLMITRDIRRAGGWNGATADVDTGTESNGFDGIRLYNVGTTTPVYDDEDLDGGGELEADANGDCLLFRYDFADDGDPTNTANQFGFRLNSTLDSVQTLSGGFGNAGCDNGTWESLTDDAAITITALNFTMDNHTVSVDDSTATIAVREITITLTGQTQIDKGQTATRTIVETVRVRTDDFDA